MSQNNDYKVYYYKNSRTGKIPVREYISELSKKEKAKVLKYIDFLQENNGYLEEPLSKHITGKIRELIVDFSKNKHRVFYFTFVGKRIILLHAFLKGTEKTPKQEITRGLSNLDDCMTNVSFIKQDSKRTNQKK